MSFYSSERREHIPWYSHTWPQFILVGGFLKLKNELTGQDFVHCKNKEVKSEWKCIDVSVAKDFIDEYGYIYLITGETAALVLQNKQDTTLQINYRLVDIFDEIRDYDEGMVLKKTYLSHEKKLALRKQQEKQKIALNEQQIPKEQAQHKQRLTTKYGATMANKILAGKYEIGMSKAVCKEIAAQVMVVEKTAATETWQVRSYWNGSPTYLYFSGDKLVKIAKN
ncbi:MAG: hypothetical protein LBP64_04955 [Tannerella sp.]|nr:hypothetical protein [Tannerella sp.]